MKVMRMMTLADIASGVAPSWYFPLVIIMIVLISLLALFIILIVLLQPGNSQGLGALTGASADTYLGKNKGRGWESRLKKWTVVSSILLIILCVGFAVLVTYGA